MFQYAAGRALALAHGVTLRLDTSDFAGYERHQGFQLAQAFAASFTPASAAEVARTLGWQRSALARRIVSLPVLERLRNKNLLVEPHFHYWDGLRYAAGHCYLRGYWQSEKYFLHHAGTLRADFAFRSPPIGANAPLAERMRRENAVSLHVRRGDYVSHRATAALHGALPPAYYEAAVAHILDRVPNPVFYVFSDDIPWVKKHLRLAAPTYFVEHNRQAFDDLQLMSLCRHHVIANSSFSWWGAWLNQDPEKIVVAPRQWFAQPRRVDDLLPASWVKL